IKAAAEAGDRRALLVATRDRIAAACDSPQTPPRDLAALTRRLLDIAKEIEAIDARDEDQAAGAAAVDDSFDAATL
ncbi:MAG TPA: hypothetical protein VJR50_01040, partial [Mycobacterium sp.]|nr:hypothetical protein [Mycobacterium sp.]